MSIARLNKSERASYLIGEAFRKFINDKTQDPHERRVVWTAYIAVMDACLELHDREFVMIETGNVDPSWFGQESEPQHYRPAAASPDDDDPPF